MDLGELRRALDGVDTELIELAARRQSLVAEIGRIKRAQGRLLRDFAREREVLERASANAERAGLDPGLARSLLQQLIEASLTTQEQDRVRAVASGAGQRALVIGGGGRMGGWFARFLDAQGYSVTVADPAGSPDAFPVCADWREADFAQDLLAQDLIVVAAPLRASAAVLAGLAERNPGAVVFDIGSLKSPLRGGLEALVAAGVRVTSMHPMFGPSANVLAGRHVIFIDLGVPEATDVARSLFAHTTAVPVSMSLDEHDRAIGYVLGLSHALNIAFFTALAQSGEMAERLAELSSTTFDRQLAIARGVADENPHLYYEIQRLNEQGDEALAALEGAVRQVLASVRSGDESAFVALMQGGRGYFTSRGAAR